MIEDKAFNAFLKAKLEEDLVVPAVSSTPPYHGVIGRALSMKAPRLRPYALAASLTVICGVFSWQFVASDDDSAERNTLHAIELLDDPECVASADTFAEKLLAWQDAPFGEIEN